MKKIMIAGCMFLAAGAVASPFEKPAEAIKYRQSAFTLIAANFGDMAAMVKGSKEWDQKLFSQRAQFVSQLTYMPEEGFKYEGSDKGETKARPEIWSDWNGFSAKLTTFQQDMANLANVARDGDEKATKRAFAQAAKNCKSCHSDYKYR
ncbi:MULTISPECIES: c-type cytochrome [Photobacterium]|uniref:Cytochrome C n=1 Tax=Photobacterium ganghwense TaxID=320778 RepID=A0A0J1K0S9_9GAMM|nr:MULTISPECIES: cytochrome c [Photobacterium]KLV08072.1 cytochrome C [Photobacterium ganghwense]MBV1839742.1 cytochrome c [Photobacterium ganghwense]PSU07192.1 cytochrome C [Photobacterium ganghwense]QSV15945.1 cytochrome c [Photobacterium ganghwense]